MQLKVKSMESRIFNLLVAFFHLFGKLQVADSQSKEPISTSSYSRKLDSRIIGGTIVKSDRYPYFSWLHIQVSSFGPSDSGFCGGSLIAPDVVMSAAHCIEYAIKIDVWVNSTSRDYNGYEFYRNSIRTVTHPAYKPYNGVHQHDIGLIFLNSPVNGVELLRWNRNESLPASRSTVTAIGFGATGLPTIPPGTAPVSISSYLPEELMETSFKTITNAECMKRAGSWRVKTSDLCSYDEKKGVCFGDSGGPLLLPSSTSQGNVQIGIVSRSASSSYEPVCIKAGIPQVFTRVSYYTAWIDENICKFSTYKPSNCPSMKPINKRPTAKPTMRKLST
jgi:secreted trypsin-like serine protease